MAGCDTHPKPPGDDAAWLKDIAAWAGLGAVGGGVLAGLLAGGIGLLTILAGALAGAIVGGFVGYAVEWFRRLKMQDPETITVCALVRCAGKNSGVPPFADGDWTFNVGEAWRVTAPVVAGLDIDEVRTRAAPGSGLSRAFETTPSPDDLTEVFHVEISSQIGNFGAVGSAVGTVAGAIAGAAACAALGVATLGLGLALCALLVALGAALGGLAGAAIGGGLGAIADALSDFDRRGKAVEPDCQMMLTGRWVTDINHEHNEIHDLEAACIVECEVADAGSPLKIAGAVGTGRHPSGRDP